MQLERMSLGPLGTNCYIAHNEKKEALIFDPSGDPETIISKVKEDELQVQAILLTHAHFDHIAGLDRVRKELEVDVYLHHLEKEWLEDPSLNGSLPFIGEEISTGPPEKLLTPGKKEFGSLTLEAIHTPGHSPGSVSFLFSEANQIISGDVLFQQGIGRTDLPGGDNSQLENSIRNRLFVLSDTLTVNPGHGLETTIGYEKKHNPFVSE